MSVARAGRAPTEGAHRDVGAGRRRSDRGRVEHVVADGPDASLRWYRFGLAYDRNDRVTAGDRFTQNARSDHAGRAE
jgi:hypothetical protein